ncbi:MAG: WG repeat-containing protein, partial [Planctomycetes bacterium]|nr:WG repeat-containing protein [Planctomycetota bacterium]
MAISDNEPSALSHEQVQQHLRRCSECRVALGRLAAVDARFNNMERPRHEVDVWPLLSSEIAGHVRADQPGRADASTHAPHRGRRSILIALAVSLALVAMCVRTVIYHQSHPDFSNEMVEGDAPDVAAATPKPYEIPYGPIKQVDPEEFRRRYAKYFDKEHQQQQQTALRDRTDADHWRPSTIRVRQGPLGTLFIDDEGKVALATRYPLVDVFSEGLAMVGTTVSDDARRVIGGYGFIDKTGRLVVPGGFEAANRFSDGLAAVKKDGKWGYINRKGRIVISPRYNEWADPFCDGMARVAPDRNTTQFIDTTGKVIFELDENIWNAGKFSEGLIFANLPATLVKVPDGPTVDQVAPER